MSCCGVRSWRWPIFGLMILFALGSLLWRRPEAGPTPSALAQEEGTRPSFQGRTGEGEAKPETKKRVRVVIVGAGISGLCSALELARGGADVTVLDMSSVFGGHAVMSQGGLSIVDTPVQSEAGLDDSPDLAYQDFIKWGEDADPAWVRYYVDHSRREIFDWLADLGVSFSGVATAPGNSVDRFHQPVGRGIGLVTPIYRACLRHSNIRFEWNTQAVKLLNDEGHVTGVVGKQLRDGRERSFDGDAVILATGGFQSNLDMVREFWPAEFRFPKKILAGSGRNSVGLGHQLAQSVGGELVKMDHQWNYFTGIPDPRHPQSKRGLSAANMYGIIVNPSGRRFANLHNWAKEVMPKLLAQEQATLWFVFDEATRKRFVVSGTEWTDFDKVDRLILQNKSLVKKAETIRQLAIQTGLPPDNLVATLRHYNELVDEGEDRDFGRFGPRRSEYNNRASPKLVTPPFYAMQAYPLTRKSMGGVAIDLKCQVLDKQRRVIPGLYAVGELTGLAGINGKAALEGTFLGPCVLTGRVAARSIVGKSTVVSLSDAAAARQSAKCLTCHDVEALVANQRTGYWHFEKSHKVARDRKLSCLRCHLELAPYKEADHQIDPLRLTNSCVHCHVAQE